MPRPRVTPERQRRPWRVYLSQQELDSLGFSGDGFSDWAREKLFAEMPKPAEPKRPQLELPPWGQPDAKGNIYSWESHSRTRGTLTIRNGARRLAMDFADPEVLEVHDGVRILYRDYSEVRDCAEEEEG